MNAPRRSVGLFATFLTLVFTTAPSGAASFTEGDFWIIGSANGPTSDTEFKISVHPDRSGFAGQGNVGSTTVLVDEEFNDPILEYAFYTDGGDNTTAVAYASSGGGRIPPLSGLLFSSGYFGSPDAGRVWESTDPGFGYMNAPDFNNDIMLGNTTFVDGSVDISGLTSGSIYLFYGAYREARPVFDLVMTDTNGVEADLTLSGVGNNDFANNNEFYACRVDFVNDSGYDLITYSFDDSDVDNGRFTGLVLTFKGVSISKSVSADAVNLDQGTTNLIYTLEVANSYTTSVGSITVTDAVPPEVSFVSSTPPAAVTNGNEYVFNINNLGPQTSAWISIEVQVTSSVPAVITNTATLGTTNTNVMVTATLDTATTLLYRPTDLTVTKSVVVSGTNVDYTILVTNRSVSDATGVAVVDGLPGVLDFQSANPTENSVAGNDYTFNLGTLAAGASTSIMISAVYTSPASILITNTATATTTWYEDILSNNTDSVASPVGGALVLQKFVSDALINLDLGTTNLIYTIQVLNTFTVSLSGVTVTDALPAEVSFTSALPPATVTNGSEYGFNLGTLGPGSNLTITMDVLMTSSVPATITNVAIGRAAETNLTGVVQDTAETLLYRPADLDLAKSANLSGTNLTYTLTVTNLGLADATGVSLVDIFPPAVTYLGASPSPNSIVGNTYTFNLGTLAAGAGTSVMMFAYSTSTVPITVTNEASVTTTWFEDVLVNNNDSVVSTISGGLDLALTKSVSTTNLSVGTNLTYTLDIVNNSTGAVGGVMVTDSLPAVVTFLSSTPPVIPVGSDVVFNLGTLAGGASTSLIIEVSTETLIQGAITNVAHVAMAGDINPANDSDFAVTLIPDTDGDGDANPGDPDDDNDGMNDGAEQIAGTDQLDEFSYLWLRIARGSNEFIRMLTWPGVTGRTYHVQSSFNILADNWVNAQTNIAGPPVSNELMNVWQTNAFERIYYRIGVERP